MSYRVFATGFEKDFTGASPSCGMRHAGDFSPEELLELLRQIGSIPIEDADGDFAPRLRIQGAAQESIVWVSKGNLYYAAASQDEELGDVMTPEEVCEQLRSEVAAPAPSRPHAKSEESPHRVVVLLACIFGTSLLLQFFLILSGYYSFNSPLEYAPAIGADSVARLQSEHTGVFWSDTDPERTVLVLGEDGKARIYVASAWNTPDDFMLVQVASYEFGYMEGQLHIVMDGNDPVEITPDGALLLDGDTLTSARLGSDLEAALAGGPRQ